MYKINAKKLILICFLFFVWFANIFSREIKVLAIGNSFSEDAVETYLYDIGIAEGVTFIIGNLVIAGASLETHEDNAKNNAPVYSYRKIVNGYKTVKKEVTMETAIRDEAWDYISLQQTSKYAGMYDTFSPYLTNLINYLKNNATNSDVQFLWHMTWAYAENSTHSGFVNYYDKNQLRMYDAILNASDIVETKFKIFRIIPVGTAIQNARTSSLGDSLCRDGFHLNETYGRFTAACTWYELLTGNCVVGSSYKPNTISPFEAFISRMSAHFAVIFPNKIISLSYCTKED